MRVTDAQRDELYRQKIKDDEQVRLEAAHQKEKEKQSLRDAHLSAYYESTKARTKAARYSNLRQSVKKELLESALNTIFDDSFGSTNFDNTNEDDNFNQSIIANFISDEGIDELLDVYESKTEFLSKLSLLVREASDEAMEDIDDVNDEDSLDTYVVDPSLKDDIINSLKGDEDLETVIDTIRFNVSRATEDFIQKNIIDKLSIKDIMYSTKETLDSIKNGDDVLDDEIRQEQTMVARRAIKELSKRPHSIFEQMVINLTEQVLTNDELRKALTLEETGKLDMDKIVKRATSYYTFLEMVNTLRLREVDKNYILEAVSMK